MYSFILTGYLCIWKPYLSVTCHCHCHNAERRTTSPCPPRSPGQVVEMPGVLNSLCQLRSVCGGLTPSLSDNQCLSVWPAFPQDDESAWLCSVGSWVGLCSCFSRLPRTGQGLLGGVQWAPHVGGHRLLKRQTQHVQTDPSSFSQTPTAHLILILVNELTH